MRLAALAPLLLATAAGAQVVYKCQESGHTVYSDTLCQGAQQLEPEQLRGNTLRRAPENHLTPADVAPRPQHAVIPSNCPSEQDIRNLETTLTSVTFRGDKRFIAAEIRRARACSKEGGNYTDEDWRRIKQAQDDQNDIRRTDRKNAKATAEAIHSSAASPQEQQRMLADRLAEQQREAARRNGMISSCDGGGCWDFAGVRYNGNGMTLFRATDGAACQRIGPRMECR